MTVRDVLRDRVLTGTIAVLVIFAMTFIWFLGHARAAEASDNGLISAVRRQMTLTAALGIDALLYLGGDTRAATVNDTLDEIVIGHLTLANGNRDLGIRGASSPEEERLLAAAAVHLDSLIRHTEALLDDASTTAGIRLARSSEAYRDSLVPVGSAYVAAAAARIDRNTRIEIIGIVVGAALALGVAMLVGPYTRRRRDLANAIARARESHSRAHVDQLTGLPRRTAFRDQLVQAVHRAARGEQFTGLLVVAVDRAPTRPIAPNDPDADVIIASVAKTIADTLRGSDVVARSGRDQFAVLVDIRRTEDAGRVAEKILDAVVRPDDLVDFIPTLSVGVAVAPVDTDIADDLMQMATAAMLSVRRTGGNGYGFYSVEHADGALGAMQIMERLRGSVRRDEGLWLAYQPIIRVADRSLAGYEALIRWRDHELGDMLPGDFIPIAEQNDLIIDLGAWVIDNACRQIAQWTRTGNESVRVSVNVSPRQVRHGSLLEVTTAALERHGVSPECLEMEITEAVMLDDESRPLSRLRDLRALGITIAVDDFGTGYSSLSYLRQFPVNTLKIDRSFVQGLVPGSNDIAIAKTIIALGYSLGLDVVAEGVETEEQFEILHDLGCDLAQGYLFSAPVPAGAVELATRSHRRTARNPAFGAGR